MFHQWRTQSMAHDLPPQLKLLPTFFLGGYTTHHPCLYINHSLTHAKMDAVPGVEEEGTAM